MVRELGPVLTALMVTGRVAHMAAGWKSVVVTRRSTPLSTAPCASW
jgi:ABC-type transporter Mla maintaining outer membrane lipid asymmetry permease subunit MlaE